MSTTRNAIVVSGDPKGHFVEGFLTSGQTPLPGTVLYLTSAGTYSVFNGTTGATGELVITCEDWGQGKTVDDAYADPATGVGSHFFGYIPANGDVLQMLLKNISGTSDSFNIGDTLSVDSGTGKLVAASGLRAPFVLLEAVTPALTADALHLVRVNLN